MKGEKEPRPLLKGIGKVLGIALLGATGALIGNYIGFGLSVLCKGGLLGGWYSFSAPVGELAGTVIGGIAGARIPSSK